MIKLKPIKVLVTAAGAPGASTLIRYLRNIAERKVYVIGVDASQECIGSFFADAFESIPQATEANYVDSLLAAAQKHEVDCVVVASSYEVEVVAPHVKLFEEIGIKILVSSAESLRIANNKKLLYQLFENDPKVRVPQFKVVNTLEQFIQACESMGFPEKQLCFKPPVSKGSRGFRYISHNISRADLLLNYKPDSKYISIDEMIDIFKNENFFPELLVMERLSGEEIDSMVLAFDGEPLLITHKTREKERGGVITHGEHVERPDIVEAIQTILKKVKLSYNIGIQFMDGYLMEINPRLSTFLYMQDWVEPYFAIKFALGEYTNEDVKALQNKVPKDLRMIRYFDQHFFVKEKSMAV